MRVLLASGKSARRAGLPRVEDPAATREVEHPLSVVSAFLMPPDQ